MIQIDSSLLDEVGLGAMPAADKNLMLRHVYETLERRVGISIAGRLDNDDLEEFEFYFERKDDKGAFAWLESHVPDYKDVVASEFERLKQEIIDSADAILASYAHADGKRLRRSNNGPTSRTQLSDGSAESVGAGVALALPPGHAPASALDVASVASAPGPTAAEQLRLLLAEQREKRRRRSGTA